MLARLDAIPGVRRSRVEASGRFFLLSLDGAAEEGRVVEAAVAALQGLASPLPPEEAEAQVAAWPRGDPWLSAEEILGLSYLEARVVARATASRVAGRTGLSSGERDLLAELLRRILFETVERVHAEGGRDSPGWFYDAWPALAAAAVERARAFLDGARLEAVATALRAEHSREA